MHLSIIKDSYHKVSPLNDFGPFKQIHHLSQQPVCQLIHPHQGTWYGLLRDIIIESRCLA